MKKWIVLIVLMLVAPVWAATNLQGEFSNKALDTAISRDSLRDTGDFLGYREEVTKPSNNKVEIVLTSIIGILTLVAEILRRLNKQSGVANEIFIRAIEKYGRKDLKEEVAAVAASEGHTEMIRRKVEKITEDPKQPIIPITPPPSDSPK